MKCLEKKPENRYQSFGELKDELEKTRKEKKRKEKSYPKRDKNA